MGWQWHGLSVEMHVATATCVKSTDCKGNRSTGNDVEHIKRILGYPGRSWTIKWMRTGTVKLCYDLKQQYYSIFHVCLICVFMRNRQNLGHFFTEIIVSDDQWHLMSTCTKKYIPEFFYNTSNVLQKYILCNKKV